MDKSTLHSAEMALIILIGISSILFTFDADTAKFVVDIHLVMYLLLLLVNYSYNKSFNLYQIWIAAYIFIVWSEMEIVAAGSLPDNYVVPYIRYTLSNCAFLLGYHLLQRTNYRIVEVAGKSRNEISYLVIIFILYAYYILSKYVETSNVFFGGRSYGSGNALGSGSLLGSLITSVGMMLPALIGYFYTKIKHRPILTSLLLSLPIFLILLITTSRFKFLFSILPYLIVTGILDLKYSSFKKNVLLSLFVVIIIVGTGFLKSNRNIAIVEIDASEILHAQNDSGDDMFESAAYQMSPEGVVYMAAVADDYFTNHDLHYGKECAFLLYFWVPRSWWPDKPTMLDSWLIREYENVSEGYSSASGFIGELRADFGWLCVFFMFLFGMIVRRLDGYTKAIINRQPQSFYIVLISILYPWIFFFVRSPLTATMALLWNVVIWIIMASILNGHSRKKA